MSTFKEGSWKKSGITCTTIYSIDPIPLNYFYSSRIWGKRIEETFVDAVMPQSRFSGSDPSCQTGYKFCGGISKSSWIWVRNQENWPINDISIEQLADPSTVPEGYSAQSLGDGYYVLFTSNANKAPIARLKIAAGRICAVQSEFDYPPDRKKYLLLNVDNLDRCSSQISGLHEDPRFQLIASINEQRLFDDNKITPVVQNLPRYNTSEGAIYEWKLYSSEFYEWSYDCSRYQDYSDSATNV